jgi:hypothetical protein
MLQADSAIFLACSVGGKTLNSQGISLSRKTTFQSQDNMDGWLPPPAL